MKYKYKYKSFFVKEIIEIPDNSIVINSSYDCAVNHHPYERPEGDKIHVQWLEPIKEK